MAYSNLISEWIEEKQPWMYVIHTKVKAFVIPPKGKITLPQQNFKYEYPKILLLHLSALFDHPSCGARIRTDPNFDSETNCTVNIIGSVFSRTDPIFYALVPPFSPPGVYIVRMPSSWPGIRFLELSVINTDTAPHWCFSLGYMLAVQGTKGEPFIFAGDES